MIEKTPVTIPVPDRVLWEGRLRNEEGAMYRVILEFKDSEEAEKVCKYLVAEARTFAEESSNA